MTGKDLRGSVAEASSGSIGIIYTQKIIKNKHIWIGMSLNGNPWSSRRPKVLAYSLHEYIAKQIEDKISSEKKSYLDALRRVRKNLNEDQSMAISEAIETINERASERRESRKFVPITKEQSECPIDDEPLHGSSLVTLGLEPISGNSGSFFTPD